MNTESEKELIPFPQELLELRTFVLVELEDGKVYQVELNKSQYEKVLAAISSPCLDPTHWHMPNMKHMAMDIHDGWSLPQDTFLGLKARYGEEE